MRDTEGYENAAALLPQDIRQAALALSGGLRGAAEEIRLRSARRPALLLPEGESPFGDRAVSPRDLDTVLENATRASAHTALECVASGFVTVRGGCRVGLCGETVVREGGVRSIRRLSSISIRIPRQHRGCAAEVYSGLLGLGLPDTLIVSPPGAGKTTLLRELVRLVSEGGRRVSLIDERAEIAGVWDGLPLFDVGPCTDVMTGAPKPEAAAMLIRAMSPQVLAMDEITTAADVEAARSATGCGVRLLATAHAGSARELAARPVYRPLLEDSVFRAVIAIDLRGGVRRYRLEELGG